MHTNTRPRAAESLADGARRLDVDDDRIVGIDQVVGRVGEEGVALLRPGPLRRGIGGRGELRLDRARRAEGGVVENRQILPDRTRRRVGIDRRRVPVLAGGRALLVRIRFDQAGVDREPLAADEPLRDAPAHRRLEDVAEQVAVPEPSVPVLGEGRMVRNPIRQVQAAEPAVRQIEVDLLAKPSLRADAEAVANEQHPDHQLRIDRGPARRAVERRQARADVPEVDEQVD
jgi:hypothetical protein